MKGDWEALARAVVEWLDEQRASHLATGEDGRVVMPSFDELAKEAGRVEAAKKLLAAACIADKRIADAIATACANAKGADHDLLRELVSLLPVE